MTSTAIERRSGGEDSGGSRSRFAGSWSPRLPHARFGRRRREIVQDVYLDAWRAFAFRGRSSFRTWLYRIATRAFVKALDARRKRRPLPSDLEAAGAWSAARTRLQVEPDVLAWLQPAE